MKSIKVKIYAEFKRNYNNFAKRGTMVLIDRITGYGDCKTYLYMRVSNIWRRPRWFDSDWFEFRRRK